jgi:Flp pilus assembly pilin Flp
MDIRRPAARIWRLALWRENRAQDLIEYALIAGFVAVVAGAVMPGAASSILSKIASLMGSTSTQGSAM